MNVNNSLANVNFRVIYVQVKFAFERNVYKMKSIKRTMAMCAAATLVFSTMAVMPASAADLTAKVVADKTTVEPGDSITISVELENNPGINGWQFNLAFDDTVFVPTTGKGIYGSGVKGPKAGVVKSPLGKFNWVDNDFPIEDDGEIMHITFTVAETAAAGEYVIKISDGRFVVSKEEEEGGGSTPLEFTTTDVTVKVNAPEVAVKGLDVTPATIAFKAIGETASITAKVTPDNATNKKVSYKSADEKIATVDETGKVTAKGEGETTITVTADGAAAVSKTVAVSVAHTHVTKKVAAKDSTCTEQGNIEYYECTACGKLFEDEAATKETTLEKVKKPLAAHDFTKKDTDKKYLKSAGTCTQKAVYYYSCSVCGEAGTTTFEGETDPDNHVNTKTEGYIAPTYEADGFSGNTVCQDCGKVIEGKVIPKLEYSYEKVPAVAATCDKAGNIEYYKRLLVDGTADGKLFKDDKGTEEITEAQTVVKALGHKWGAPTYEFNSDYTECTATRVCENDKSHTQTAKGKVTMTVTKERTYEAEGAATVTATFTEDWAEDQTKDITLSAKKYSYDKVDAVAATCEADGNIEYYKRKTEEGEYDGKLFKDALGAEEITAEDTVVAALGHKFDSVKSENWAEDFSSCTVTLVCANDPEHTKDITTDKISIESDKAATCTEAGETVYVAEFDDEVAGTRKLTVTKDALGHEWSKWKVTKEATEDAEGEETRTCSVCSETETRAIPKLSKDNKDNKGSGGDNKPAGDGKTDPNGSGNAGTSNPVTGAAAALGMVAAAIGSLAIFRKRK